MASSCRAGWARVLGGGPLIFVTVGHQMPFDRLVAAVDSWAAANPEQEVFAQIGHSTLRPRHVRWAERIDPDEFQQRIRACEVVVGHAGMGTIMTALEFAKPVLVMPRRASIKETRNDHQVATASRLSGRPGIHVAKDEVELRDRLDHLAVMRGGPPIPSVASDALIGAVRQFVFGSERADAILHRRRPEPTVLAPAE